MYPGVMSQLVYLECRRTGKQFAILLLPGINWRLDIIGFLSAVKGKNLYT